MDIRKLAIAAALGTASSLSFAAGTFDGPFVQAGIGYANAEAKLSPGGTIDDDSFIGQIAAGYSQSFGQFNLAGSAYYVIGDQKASSVGPVEFKGKDSWGISIDPGYYFNASTLGYLKLGYVHTTGVAGLGGQSYEEDFNGYAYGLGLKYSFTPKLYGVAEVQQANFQDKTVSVLKIEPNAFTAIIGIGYKF